MKKLMITGAGGFLGTNLIKKLYYLKEYEIVAVISGRREIQFPFDVRIEKADLLSEEGRKDLLNKEKPDILVHLAWGLSDKNFLNDPVNIEWLEASKALLHLFKENGGKSFLFSGSSSEYGYECGICREMGKAEPSDLYGKSKLDFEKYANEFCNRVGIKAKFARVFPVYGPGEKHILHAIPSAIFALMNEGKFVCKGPNNAWDYIYIEDAAKAMVKLLQSEYCGTVNICSGRAVTMKNVFCEISNILNKQDAVIYENESVAGKTLVGDKTILCETLEYVEFTPFEEGIKKTVEWFRDQFSKENA